MEHSPDDPFDLGSDAAAESCLEPACPGEGRGALIPAPCPEQACPGEGRGRGARHDGFTPERRRLFKQTLRETGCVRDACRVAGISDSAAYKARRRDAEFAAEWDSALSMAGGDLEILAWQRAVEGVEEEVWAYGKLVGTRVKRDERLFRMLLQSSDPDRHGGPALRSPAAIERRLRADIEAERREAEMGWEQEEALREKLARKIERLRARQQAEREAAARGGRDPAGAGRTERGRGWTETGAAWTGGGAGRTEPEPPGEGAAASGVGENARESAGNGLPGPRIHGL